MQRNRFNIRAFLKAYEQQDYVSRRKALFLFYFNIAVIVVSLVVFFTTIILQLNSPAYETVNWLHLLPIIAAFVAFSAGLYTLQRGKLRFTANLVLLTSLVAIWLVIFLDKSKGTSKINTIVFVFAALSMLPLLLTSRRRIKIYAILNFSVFFLFLLHLHRNLELYDINVSGFRDIAVDISVAMLFSLVIHHQLFSINRRALNDAKKEIERREKVAAELQYHKDNLVKLVREKTRDLEFAIAELEAKNDDLNQKNEIIDNQNTELRATLENLKETQSKLFQAEKMASIGTLTSGVAHEINNPLNYIMGGYLGLKHYFEEHGTAEAEKTGFLLSSIKEGIDRTAGIVKGLNQFSGDDSDMEEDCEIHSIIDNCLVILKSQLRFNTRVTKNYCVNHLKVKGNNSKLHQVFINILTNANQAIDDNGMITIDTVCKGEKVKIIISDDGCGIRKEHIGQVTDPFFTTRSPGEGAGLGLSIAYSMIQEHNGTMVFESEPGKGTSVILEFPLKQQ